MDCARLLTSRRYREDIREERRLKKLMDLCQESDEALPTHVLEGLSMRSKEFRAIRRFLEIGQADRPMKLKDVFIVHQEETEKSPELSGDHRALLWHGSPICNVGGIVSNGLMIRPKGVKPNGARHGHGLYFADMAAKAAHYCFHSTPGEERVLFLFEVALGTVQEEEKESEEEMPLRDGFDSIKAIGHNFPDPDGDWHHPNGFRVPLGKAIVEGECARRFNEFIVFSTAHVRLRYIARVQMNWERPE